MSPLKTLMWFSLRFRVSILPVRMPFTFSLLLKSSWTSPFSEKKKERHGAQLAESWSKASKIEKGVVGPYFLL